MEDEKLERCKEEVQELSEENDALRRANETFGGLAERLNVQLHEERRTHDDEPAPDTTADPRSTSLKEIG